MKKKLLAALITVAMAGTCAAALAACNTTPSNDGSHDHDYEGVELTPIMNSDGTSEYHSRKCKVDGCNQSKDAAKHEYETVTTEATCTTAKSVKYTCKYCSYEKTETEGEALGHSWGEWEITSENMPAADKDGKATRSCTRQDCNAVDTTTLTVPQLWIGGEINPVYDNWVLKNTADCEHEGTATYTFVNTQNQVHIDFTGETPALGHDWNETVESVDEDNHHITCKRNAEHIKPDSTAAHTKKTTETPSLKYNNQSGKWEHIYVTTCEDGCDYKKEFKGQEADLNDGGEGATLSAAETTVTGSGTYASPFTVSASNTREYTVTIPANAVVSLRFTDRGAMGIFAVTPVDGENLSVIYGDRVEAVAVGERAKSDPYFGERGGSLDFALTTTNGEAATIKFRFFDNDNYYIIGNPANVEVDTDYTDEVPGETDVRHTFTPDEDGVYKFTVTGGMAMLDMGKDGTSGGNDFSETLYAGRIYTIYVSTGMDREAGEVTFTIERTGDILEPELGSAKRPIEITEIGDYEVKIEPASWGVSSVYYAFTPSVSGLYTFFDENSANATYMLHNESPTGEMLANSMNNSDKSYSYIECELEAGVTYYLGVSSTENKSQTVNMTISLHEHEFATGWTTDAKYHWHAATCEHTDSISDKGAHTYSASGKCTVCDMNKIEFNAQITVTDGTNTYDNVTVTAKLSDGTVVASGTTANGGVVTLALIPDDYVLELTNLPATCGYLAEQMSISVVDKAITFEAKVYEKQTYSVTVKMPDGTTPANGVTVTFTNSVTGTFTAVTEEGVATIQLITPMYKKNDGTIMLGGSYTVTFELPESLSGDYTYTGDEISLTTANATSEITLANLFAYILTLVDGDNNALPAGIVVTIMNSSTVMATATTVDGGIATFTKKIVAGEYTIALSNDYVTEAKTSTTVNTLTATCTLSGGGAILGGGLNSATLINGTGEHSIKVEDASSSGYFQFSGNGKKYTVTLSGSYFYIVRLNGTTSKFRMIQGDEIALGANVSDSDAAIAATNESGQIISFTVTISDYIWISFNEAFEGTLTITEVSE